MIPEPEDLLAVWIGPDGNQNHPAPISFAYKNGRRTICGFLLFLTEILLFDQRLLFQKIDRKEWIYEHFEKELIKKTALCPARCIHGTAGNDTGRCLWSICGRSIGKGYGDDRIYRPGRPGVIFTPAEDRGFS